MRIIAKGVDVSHWQGDFDMARAKNEGYQFAILKGGGGDCGLYADSRFAGNYAKAAAQGMHLGAYWFSKALTREEAVKEADYFYENCLQGRCFDLPVYIDVEHKAMLALGKRKLTDLIHAFCRRLEEKDCWVGIYSSLACFRDNMVDSELQRYAHWVACWGKSCAYNAECFGMWQYGGEINLICSNRVAGVVCDQNYMLLDYPALIPEAGKNGFSKAGEPKTTAQLALEAIRGIWGNGEARRKKLTDAGYDYGSVQHRVNELLGC